MSDPIVWPTAPPIAGEPIPNAPIEPRSPEPHLGAPPPDLPPPPPIDGRRPVASPWTRLGALGIEAVLMVCTFGFGWVGWWIVSWADGQSPSKTILHLHVVRASDGTVASFGRMALREAAGKAPAGVALAAGVYFQQWWLVGVAVAYVVVSAAVASADPRQRTVWDRIAGTVVLDGDPPPIAAIPDPAAPVATPQVEAGTALG